MRPWRTGAEVLRDRLAARAPAPAGKAPGPLAPGPRAAPGAADEPPGEPPAYVAARLAELRLLHDVPFHHLVPDAALAPAESIRFFHLDAAWTDALCEGALSVGATEHGAQGGGVTLDRARRARDRAVPGVREQHRGRPVAAGAAREATGPITGLLLRSVAVARWPGMHVRAYTGRIPPDVEPDEAPDGERVALLRLERLAPSVLLALFAGVPTLVVLEEPHDSVVLGLAAGEDGGWTVSLRAADGTLIEEDDEAVHVDVPLRPGAEHLGVVDVAGLHARLEEQAQVRAEMPRTMSPAALGLELLRPPWRQRFGAPGNT